MMFSELRFDQQVKEVPWLVAVSSLARSVVAAAAVVAVAVVVVVVVAVAVAVAAACKTDPIINKVCPDTNYSFLLFLEGLFFSAKNKKELIEL